MWGSAIIDFIANKGNRKYYIQSAFEMSSPEKIEQEKKSLNKSSIDENGLITMGIYDFLLNEYSLEA